MPQETPNPIVDKALEIVTSLQESIRQGSEFAKEQLPDIAQQYITWGAMTGGISIVVCLLILLASGSMFVYGLFYMNKRKSLTDDEEVVAFLLIAPTAVLFTITFLVLLCNWVDWLMPIYAPKPWLLKELVHLVR